MNIENCYKCGKPIMPNDGWCWVNINFGGAGGSSSLIRPYHSTCWPLGLNVTQPDIIKARAEGVAEGLARAAERPVAEITEINRWCGMVEGVAMALEMEPGAETAQNAVAPLREAAAGILAILSASPPDLTEE